MNVAPEELYNYDVITSDGQSVGTVDNVWVDDATERLEFIGVKTGWIFGKLHVVPTTDAQIGEQSITVPYAQDQIKNAPSFGADDELSATHENEIYSYYGLARETDDTPTGMGDDSGLAGKGGNDGGLTGDAGTAGAIGAPAMMSSNAQERGAQYPAGAGRARLRKVMRIEHREVPVQLQREQVSVERVDAAQSDVPTNAIEDQEVEVPVTRGTTRPESGL